MSKITKEAAERIGGMSPEEIAGMKLIAKIFVLHGCMDIMREEGITAGDIADIAHASVEELFTLHFKKGIGK